MLYDNRNRAYISAKHQATKKDVAERCEIPGKTQKGLSV